MSGKTARKERQGKNRNRCVDKLGIPYSLDTDAIFDNPSQIPVIVADNTDMAYTFAIQLGLSLKAANDIGEIFRLSEHAFGKEFVIVVNRSSEAKVFAAISFPKGSAVQSSTICVIPVGHLDSPAFSKDTPFEVRNGFVLFAHTKTSDEFIDGSISLFVSEIENIEKRFNYDHETDKAA